MACGVRRPSWRHGVSCGEWRVACNGGVWSAGRVASGLTRVACGVTVWRAANANQGLISIFHHGPVRNNYYKDVNLFFSYTALAVNVHLGTVQSKIYAKFNFGNLAVVSLGASSIDWQKKVF